MSPACRKYRAAGRRSKLRPKCFFGSSLMVNTRTESDTFGPIEVPADKLWGAQTERSRRNFRIGSESMPTPLIRALAVVKRASAEVNKELGSLDARLAEAIVQ